VSKRHNTVRRTAYEIEKQGFDESKNQINCFGERKNQIAVQLELLSKHNPSSACKKFYHLLHASDWDLNLIRIRIVVNFDRET